jgi:hypothetical protein
MSMPKGISSTDGVLEKTANAFAATLAVACVERGDTGGFSTGKARTTEAKELPLLVGAGKRPSPPGLLALREAGKPKVPRPPKLLCGVARTMAIFGDGGCIADEAALICEGERSSLIGDANTTVLDGEAAAAVPRHVNDGDATACAVTGAKDEVRDEGDVGTEAAFINDKCPVLQDRDADWGVTGTALTPSTGDATTQACCEGHALARLRLEGDRSTAEPRILA